MPITIIKTPRRLRSFLVYDMEWIPGTLQMRMIGVFDGIRYRWYKTVKAFLDGELTRENQGKWFYAHAGGLADVQFVLETLASHPSFSAHVIRASFSGSSAIIVRVTKGGHTWTFVDSFWLLRAKLAKIAKWIGMEKTGPEEEETPEEWYANVAMEELIPYNRNDCEILYRAIELFQRSMLELGGQLQMTMASCAMQLFRRKYLSKDIETSDPVNEKAAKSYIASRVEVFDTQLIDDANYFDINSSFPYAMTFPCPGELRKIDRNLPSPDPERIYLAYVDIEVPEFYLTPTPLRAGGRVFFPTGRWEAWLTSVDVELLQEECGIVHKVHEVLHFEPFHDLAEYAKDLYRKRKETDDPAQAEVYKIALNGLYGKFAECEEKSMIHVHPPANVLRRLSRDKMLFPGCYEEDQIASVPHRWVPISSHITAIARRTIYQFLGMTRNFHYVDTDGFSTRDVFSTGKELGQLKLERKIRPGDCVCGHPEHGEKCSCMSNDKPCSCKRYERAHWQYVQAKLYRQGDKVKAKGFSLGWDESRQNKKEKAIELFETLVQGGEIEVRRMRRIKENLRNGTVKPSEAPVIKRLAKNPFPKRHHDPVTGVSRPWTIKELRKRGLK